MKYVRQNEPGLLGETDAAVITKARDMYGKAVEASLEAASDDQAGVVGDTVREAFAQVGRTFTATAGRRVHSLKPHFVHCRPEMRPMCMKRHTMVLLPCPFCKYLCNVCRQTLMFHSWCLVQCCIAVSASRAAMSVLQCQLKLHLEPLLFGIGRQCRAWKRPQAEVRQFSQRLGHGGSSCSGQWMAVTALMICQHTAWRSMRSLKALTFLYLLATRHVPCSASLSTACCLHCSWHGLPARHIRTQ